MEFQINKSYKIFLDINSNTLVYKAKIIETDEDGFIKFIDDRGQTWTYNKKYIISFQELNYDILINEVGGEYGN